jgi:threonine dehydrogenase-like Zn-dependent dehydrogenase
MMRALVFDGVRRIRLAEDVPKPALESGSSDAGAAVVRVTHTAICGSDLHPFRGDERGILPGTGGRAAARTQPRGRQGALVMAWVAPS